MDGYAVTARIDRATPRLARHGAQPAVAADPLQSTDAVDPFDLVGRPFDVRWLDRWAAFRETWSQTTFFLFDADSWRR